MRKRESFMFLIELMISILIFFLIAAICVLIFSRAHRMNRSSRELNAAAQAEENIAEIVSGAESIQDAESLIKGAYPNAVFSDGQHQEDGQAENTAAGKVNANSEDGTSVDQENGDSEGSSEEQENADSEDTSADQVNGSSLNVIVPFDSNLKPTAEQGAFQLTAEIRADSGMIHTDMHFYPVDSSGANTGESVYDLATRNVLPDANEGVAS